MRKLISNEMESDRKWLDTVNILQLKGIPLNLIIHEANEYGKSNALKIKNPRK